jgi:glycosyltransferase 2 family protein
MKRKIFSVIKYLLLLIVAAALLYFAFRGISIKDVMREVLKAKLSWVFLSIMASIIAAFSRAIRWQLLLQPLGYSPGLMTTSYSLMVGYFANLAFPRLGEVTRCAAMSRTEKIPFNVLLGTVIVERGIDVLTLLLLLLLTAVLEFKRLGNFLNENIAQPIIKKFHFVTSPLFIVGLIVMLIVIVFVWRYFRNKSKQSGKESKLMNLTKGLVDGLKTIGKLKKPWLFVFHSLFIWFLYLISVWVCFYAFPFTSGLDLTAALFILVAGGLAMSAPVQGGIGAYHLLVSQGLILYGLTRQDGLTFATLLHTLNLVLIIVFGSVSLFMLFRERKKSDLKNFKETIEEKAGTVA